MKGDLAEADGPDRATGWVCSEQLQDCHCREFCRLAVERYLMVARGRGSLPNWTDQGAGDRQLLFCTLIHV